MEKLLYKKMTIIVALSAVFISSINAASFDCEKAKSKVEHLICDNPEISKLDDELVESYKASLRRYDKEDYLDWRA